jgi:hypothetical protein
MARRVFFSFHYQDVIDFRANVVRQHWVTKDREAAGYFDASIWEKAKKEGDTSLKRLINGGLDGTSNTCTLVGSETYSRPWVRYELLKSFVRGNHMFAVHINGITDKNQKTKVLGSNPLEYVGVTYSEDGRTMTLWEKNGTIWERYTKIEDKSDFTIPQVAAAYRGKGYNLGNFYPIYDWIANDGYNKFNNWVK